MSESMLVYVGMCSL